MKKLTIITVIAAMLAIAGLASAADLTKEWTVSNDPNAVTIGATRSTGAEYVRVIVLDERSLDGEAYTAGVPLMGFGTDAEALKAVQPGGRIKAIVTPRSFEGRESYTLRKLLSNEPAAQ